MDNGCAAVGILVVFGVIVAWALFRKRQLQRRATEQMRQEHPEALLIDDRAVYYGLHSLGILQTHELGGTFVITADLVRYKTWDYGKKALGFQRSFDVRIPLERLKGFEEARTFIALGPGARHNNLLLLHHLDDDGASEVLGVSPTDRAVCIAHLESLGVDCIEGSPA